MSQRPEPEKRTASDDHPARGAAPRLHEQLAAILGDRIRRGLIAPGTRLRELHVSAEFGISRAPVRKAFARLQSEGLLVPVRGHGLAVPAAVRARRSGPHKLPSAQAALRLTVEASWERIHKEVEQEIVARTAFAGWWVNESRLAEHYGVSRTVAREVLGRLHQRGVVKKDARGRWHSPALTPTYVAELYEMRKILEPVALASAMENAPPGLVERLIDEHRDAISRASELTGEELSALESGLHIELLASCPSQTLVEAIRLYQSLLVAHNYLYRWAPQLYASEPFLPEHLEILERLAGGDTAGAAAALERHFTQSLDRAVDRLDRLRNEGMPSPLSYLSPERKSER